MRRLFLIAALFLWTPAGAQNDDATPRKIEKETFVYAVRDAERCGWTVMRSSRPTAGRNPA